MLRDGFCGEWISFGRRWCIVFPLGFNRLNTLFEFGPPLLIPQIHGFSVVTSRKLRGNTFAGGQQTNGSLPTKPQDFLRMSFIKSAASGFGAITIFNVSVEHSFNLIQLHCGGNVGNWNWNWFGLSLTLGWSIGPS